MDLTGILDIQGAILQREYNWSFVPPDIGGIRGTEISRYCQSIDFGDYSMKEVPKIRYGYQTRGYAGLFTVESIKATFLRALTYQSLDDIVWAYISNWRRLVVSDQGFYGLKRNYALNGDVYLNDVSGIDTFHFILRGMFPISYPKHNFSYAKGGVATYSVEFNVDIVEKAIR